MSKIIVIGSSNTDMVIKSDKLPLPGETILGGTFFLNPGGKGANQAVAAARLGGNVIFVTKTGNDIFGAEAKQHFEKEGIETRFIITDPENPSGVALINVDSKGENCIVVAPGSNNTLVPSDIDPSVFIASPSDIFLFQLEIPLETVEFASSRALEQQCRVILNPAPAKILPETLLQKLFLITPNETEASMLSGVKVIDADSAFKAACILKDRGVKNIIITLGSSGAFVMTEAFTGIVKSYKVEAIDTTAAGDVFNGALAVALSEGMDTRKGVEFANKAASISVTRIGAQSSAPYRYEL